MKKIVIPFPELFPLAQSLCDVLSADMQFVETRRFPDGETYLRLPELLHGRDIILVAPLDRPDEKTLPIIFAAMTARELGANSVGLVAPYLPYMRQDKRFKPGEAITSTHFAGIVSQSIDWLVTIDPHLHRRNSLSEIYSVPTAVVHAAPVIADWIANNVKKPLLVGPDSESEQWVRAVADGIGADWMVLEKKRYGDENVVVSVPNVEQWYDHTPVIVDDIVSSAKTMIATVKHLRATNMSAPTCIGVHAIFAGSSYQALLDAGAGKVVSCNTVRHQSNQIDVSAILAQAINKI